MLRFAEGNALPRQLSVMRFRWCGSTGCVQMCALTLRGMQGRFCLVSSTWAHQMSMGKIFSDAQRSERKAEKAPPVARTKEQSFGYGACKGGESMFFPTCTGRLVFINIA